MRSACLVGRIAFAAAFALLPAMAHATTIDFDSLSDATSVTTQFAGVVFASATAITAGISLNELEFPPHSGQNVALDDGGPISVTFATPQLSVGAYFTYTVPLTLEAFDASHTLLGSVSSTFTENFVSSGNPPNELLQLAFPTGISSITVLGDPAGSSFVIDDLTFSPVQGPGTPVPEPASITLTMLGIATFCRRRVSTRSI